MFSIKRKEDLYAKSKGRKMKADFPFSKCLRWRGGMFVVYTKGEGAGCLPRKEKRGYVHKTEKEKMKADVPMGKKRFSHAKVGRKSRLISRNQKERPVLVWIWRASSLSRRVYQDQVDVHHVHNWFALWQTGSSHPNSEVQDATHCGGTGGYYHQP